jgi:gluconate 5-dehydrogenase
VFDLTGKVAIVTGGAGGLGRPIALGLAKCGADVVVDDLASANPQSVADDIQALGRKAMAVTADVTSAESMKEMADLVVREFGKIDILVNVAGINARFSAEEMPPEEFEKVIRFNIAGTFLPCQAVGKVMIEQKRGKIINMGSVRGSVAPSIGGTAYASSKGGVHQLTRTLAAEWAKYGINVNGIAPALVMTAMTKDFLSKPEIYSKMTAEIPLARLGFPEDLIGPIVLLASDESDFMTGQIIYVDGGLSAV